MDYMTKSNLYRKEKEEDYSPTVLVPPQETKPEIIILNEHAEKGMNYNKILEQSYTIC